MWGGGIVRVAFKLVVVGLCLSCITFVVACGSEPGGSPSPASTPSELSPQKQAARYFKELTPVLKVDKALSTKTSSLSEIGLQDLDDAYSVAAAIDSEFLPDIKRAQAMLATIKPPPQFRVAHARLRRMWVLTYGLLAFVSESLQQAVYTQTLPPGFEAKADRLAARLREAGRKYEAAMRAGAKRSHVKVTKRLLLESSY